MSNNTVCYLRAYSAAVALNNMAISLLTKHGAYGQARDTFQDAVSMMTLLVKARANIAHQAPPNAHGRREMLLSAQNVDAKLRCATERMVDCQRTRGGTTPSKGPERIRFEVLPSHDIGRSAESILREKRPISVQFLIQMEILEVSVPRGHDLEPLSAMILHNFGVAHLAMTMSATSAAAKSRYSKETLCSVTQKVSRLSYAILVRRIGWCEDAFALEGWLLVSVMVAANLIDALRALGRHQEADEFYTNLVCLKKRLQELHQCELFKVACEAAAAA